MFFDAEGVLLSHSKLRVNQAKVVEVKIPYSKCDQLGYGRVICHVRQSSTCRCIVRDLEEWIIITRDKLNARESDFLFRVGSKNLITSDRVALIMKTTAVFCGLDSDKISAHSLRYGGATMLAAAGLPQYVIAYFGGWTEDSDSLKLYTQLNWASNDKVSKVFADGDSNDLAEARIRNHIHGRRK